MKYLKLTFISNRGRVVWKFQHVAEGLSNAEIHTALKQLAKCAWLTDSKGYPLWSSDLKCIEAAYVTTTVSAPIIFELV